MEHTIEDTKELRFFSQKAIGIATFIGTPMAAGYLIRENYKSLGEPEKGRNALIISIVVTLLLFVGIYRIPEAIMDKIPNFIIPAIYMGIIYLIVEKIHGPILKNHESNGYEFISNWRAAGIGFISLIILIVGIAAYIFLAPESDANIFYDKQIEIFSKNEEESLEFYDKLETEEVEFLNTTAIPRLGKKYCNY